MLELADEGGLPQGRKVHDLLHNSGVSSIQHS